MQRHVTSKIEWMPCPDARTDHPGLAYICPLDELIVAEARDALHDIIGDRAQISYTIYNNKGQKIFVAVRKKKWGKFIIKVYNNYGNEVIEVRRPFKLCFNRVLVWAPPGRYAGSVEQVWRCSRKYAVKNWTGHKVLTIRNEGFCSLVYNIRYVCGVNAIGIIRKQCLDTLKVKHYGVSFPVQFDVRDKAVLLGACFLIGCTKY